MFYYDWRLALVCVTAAPLVVYPLVRLGQRVRRTTRRSQEELEQRPHITAEAFTGHRIVKAFGAEARESGAFGRASQRLYRTNIKVTSALSRAAAADGVPRRPRGRRGDLVRQPANSRSGRLTPGDFSAFLAAAFMMYSADQEAEPRQREPPAGDRRGRADLRDARHALARCTSEPGAPALPPLRDGRRVPGRQLCLRRRAGAVHPARTCRSRSRAGQVDRDRRAERRGQDDAGEPDPAVLRRHGRRASSIDGIDIRDVTLASLRAQIGIVTQETVLFDDTSPATSPTARRARPRARSRPRRGPRTRTSSSRSCRSGYERGSASADSGCRAGSGSGSRSRARFCKNSPILVLDEATSSLDAESERLVQDALANLMRNRTSFVIAHRLSTVRRADLIVALEQGRVAEIGTHDELLARPAASTRSCTRCRCSTSAEPSRDARAPGGESSPMIRSMTGFAVVSREEDGARRSSVTVKSVNHRFLDLQLQGAAVAGARSSRACGRWCSSGRARARRGVRSGVEHTAPPAREVELNEALLDRRLSRRIEQARAQGPGDGRPDARRSAALSAGARRSGEARRRRRGASDGALAALRRGGARRTRSTRSIVMRDDAKDGYLRGRPGRAARDARRAGRRARACSREPGSDALADAAARARSASCRADVPADRRRRAGDRAVRRRGRTSTRRSSGSAATSSTGRRLPTGREPCGRKLDFLLQEMNREINTIGSKAEGAGVPETDHRREGGAREDARAGAECRVSAAAPRACCSSCRPRPAPARRRSSSGW